MKKRLRVKIELSELELTDEEQQLLFKARNLDQVPASLRKKVEQKIAEAAIVNQPPGFNLKSKDVEFERPGH